MYCKVLVIVTLNWIALSVGFLQGQMTGMIGSLQKNEDGIDLSEWEISVLGALLNLSFTLGLLYLAVISENIGRKWCIITMSIPLILNWIIMYFAETFTTLFISRFLAGMACIPLSTLNLIAASEYVSYKSRAVLISMSQMVVPSFGMALGHVLGLLLHWRTTALIGLVLSSVHIALPYFWVESPHWLASRGRFKECELAFRKLHGSSSSAEHELTLLIKLETKKQNPAKETHLHDFRKLFQAFKQKYFWDLMTTVSLILLYFAAAGRVAFTFLATVILEGVTGTSDVLLYTLLVDGFVIVGACMSCFLLKKMNIRALFFSSGLVANGILIALSTGLYFKSNEVYFQWINVTLLALYFIVINAGPYPVMEVLLGELFPVDLKMYCYVLCSPIVISTFFVSLLVLPYVVSFIGYQGWFLMNSAISFICIACLYVRLPETKGKTLQEIEVYFRKNSNDIELLPSASDQTKNLI